MTTRIAIVSDIHGNLPALTAVLAELDRRGPYDGVVGGGDFVFGGLYPAECLREVRERGWACVRGNTDEWVVEVATDGQVPARGYEPDPPHNEMQRQVDAWCAAKLDAEAVQFLTDLPIPQRFSGPSGQTLVFVHATPWSTHPVVTPTAEESVATRMLDEAGADVLVYGHIHNAYIRQVGNRTLACAGAVGMPLDGDERAAFLIAADDGAGWSLEHVRVSWDREPYLAELAASPMPNGAGFAQMIRAAGTP